MTPEARLRFEHPSEPMPRMQLVEYPQSYDDGGHGWPDDEPAWPEDDQRSWLEDEYDIDLPYDEQEGWGDAIEVGRAVQVRSRSGTRAAVAEVRPGLFLVGVMPEAVAVGAEARAGGVVDLTASMISQVVKAIQTAVAKGKAKRQAKLAALNAPPGPAAAPALAVSVPAAAGVGCSGRCRCGRR